MFRTSITLTFGLILGCILCSSQENLQWNPLFNGQDLTNRDVKIRGYKLGNNYGKTFRVKDGIMQVRYDQYKNGFENRFGDIFYKEPFSSYFLGVQYRFSGEQVNNNPGLWAHRNNGIMLQGQDQWIRVEMLVPTDSLMVHFVNGEEVMRYGQP